MSDLISFDSGSTSDPIYEGATPQELYFIVQVNLLVVARLQIDDLLDTSEKIYKIQRPSQTMLPLGIWRWYYGLSRKETTTNLQRLYFHTQQLLQNETLKGNLVLFVAPRSLVAGFLNCGCKKRI